MNIIPAIDIIDGKCVRLTKGDYDTRKIYNEHPLEVAKMFEVHGIKYLHLVDLDGAKANHIVNYKVLEDIATNTNLEIDFGGGIKSFEDVQLAFECGAAKITVGSIAVQQPNVFWDWIKQYGAERILLGADCKERLIVTEGWMKGSKIDVVDFIIDHTTAGATQVVCTDVACDGTLKGPSLKLYEEILSKVEVELIASGGISSLQDLHMLAGVGCTGAIIGKAIYEGFISLSELQHLC